MGFLSSLFGPKQPTRPPRDIATLVAPLARSALQLVPGLPVRDGRPVHSWFLGAPDLAPGVGTPVHDDRPLDHLATIDLADAHVAQPVDWLPRYGSLAFFYDLQKQPPGSPEDRGAWSVAFSARRATSRTPDSRPMKLRSILTYPPYDRPEIDALEFNDEESDLFGELGQAQTSVEYAHQLGGYQSLIQSDTLELESEFALNGLAYDERHANSAHGQALAAGATDWRLLLQVATDESLDLMWGDAGNLYFMIRESEARAARFDNVWLISQCF